MAGINTHACMREDPSQRLWAAALGDETKAACALLLLHLCPSPVSEHAAQPPCKRAPGAPQVFIRGGNWIASDWMLRFSAPRYRAEVRMHAEVRARRRARSRRAPRAADRARVRRGRWSPHMPPVRQAGMM